MKKLIYNNPNIVVVFDDNSILKTTCTQEVANDIALNEYSDQEIQIMLDSEHKNNIAKVQAAKKVIGAVQKDPDFYYKEFNLYLKGIEVPIPLAFADFFHVLMNKGDQKELERFKNFWRWTSLIRQKNSRESFYNYAMKNSMIITDEGFVIGFRRANAKNTNPELASFVSTQFLRLKGNKKSTSVDVFELEDGGYSLKSPFPNSQSVGLLKDLYYKNDSGFTSNHSNSKGEKLLYQLGVETRLPVDECDWSNVECSRGLHVSNGGYDFSGFGDTPLAVLINPMDVVHCPYSDHSKMRVMAFTPLMALDNDCEFSLTSDVQKVITEMYSNYLDQLKTAIDLGEYDKEGSTLNIEVAKNVLNYQVETFNVKDKVKYVKTILGSSNDD